MKWDGNEGIQCSRAECDNPIEVGEEYGLFRERMWLDKDGEFSELSHIWCTDCCANAEIWS